MQHNLYLKMRNIVVRPLNYDDIESLRKWRNNSNNTKYLRKIGHITPEQQIVWFKNYLKNFDEFGFAIEETEKVKGLVGSAALYNFNDSCAEFGKLLIGHTDAHGNNVGFNSAVAIIYLAFSEFNVKKVILHCYAENAIALHIYNKVGFIIVDKHQISDEEEYILELSRERFEQLYRNLFS